MATACATDVAARIEGTEISVEALERELDAFRNNRPYVERRERAGNGLIADMHGNLATQFVVDVLTNDIIALAVEMEVRQRGIEITNEDRTFGYEQAPIAAGNRQIFEVFPRWYQRLLEKRATLAGALRRSMIRGETHEEYYNHNKEEFSKACTRDLVVRTRTEALAARGRVLDGEDFAAVARGVSLDEGTGPKGGDLGCNGRRDLLPELDAAAYSLPVGEISQPIRAEGGFHLILVDKRTIPPYDQIYGEVELVHLASGTKEMTKVVRDRLRRSNVEVSSRYGRWDERRLKVAV